MNPPVHLRPYAAEDLQLLERLLGDAGEMAHLGGPESPEAIRSRHRRYLASDGSTDGLFTIILEPEATAVGWVGYWEIDWRGGKVWECGWHLVPEHQGAGVATAGMVLLLEVSRARGSHRFMHAFPSADNTRSNALCRRLGFELLGEEQVEYPKGHMMRSNDWRLDLLAPLRRA
ncbi:MAG: hypothetical protein A2133_02610 [Actinobacteria bacterium RBG_16_64_13]|nr:MAG: hypothetical protein A2133_02610 [Actinobacteria bacterium RBG_16_64_13]